MIRVQVLNADSLAAKIGADLGKQLAVALESIGLQTHIFVHDLLATPVDYSTSPPTRSKRGESPRTDTGELQENLKHAVHINGDTYTMIVSSERPSTPWVPLLLETPTGLGRPYMYLGYTNLRQQLPTLLAEELRKA